MWHPAAEASKQKQASKKASGLAGPPACPVAEEDAQDEADEQALGRDLPKSAGWKPWEE